MQLYDVTVPISADIPVWPGDPPVRIEKVASIAQGDSMNLSRLHLGSHTGTHVDAPAHFVGQGQTVDQLAPELLVGPAFIASLEQLAGNTIQARDLAALQLPEETTRLLFKTRNSALWERQQSGFQKEYVHLGTEAAEWLVRRGVRLVGVDYLSVEAFGAGQSPVHHILLGAGIVIVEGLDLRHVPVGLCHLCCLPLKIAGGEGAPARVLVVRDQAG
jgi:arylformamidase